jgi:hypothetical protein
VNMALLMDRMFLIVAQIASPLSSENEAAKPAAPVNRQMNFSDLQKGLKAQLEGETDQSHYTKLVIGVVLVIVAVAIVVHWRQRRKSGGPPTSDSSLFRELSRGIKFPLGTKLILWWVARTARVPAAVLLISREIFEKSVADWGRRPTFGPLRQWGMVRLDAIRELLFAPPGPVAERGK